MQHATLVFLVNRERGQICLALKKRGLGAGMLNGYGGKANPGETIQDAALRELAEESNGVSADPSDLNEVGLFQFYHPHKLSYEMIVHVFLLEKWSGEPTESEEMRPNWHRLDSLPLDQMWPDDRYWLNAVLAGEKLAGWFRFDSSGQIQDYKLVSLQEQEEHLALR